LTRPLELSRLEAMIEHGKGPSHDHDNHDSAPDHEGDGRGVSDEDGTHAPDHHHPHDDQHEHRPGLFAAIGDLIRPHSRDSATKIDSALESDSRGVHALKLSLVALLITAVLQLIVVIATNVVGDGLRDVFDPRRAHLA